MTTVIGIQQADRCSLFADSLVVDTNTSFKHKNMVKVAKRGKYLLGISGNWGVLQAIAYVWEPPVPTQDDLNNLYEFMITTVAPSLRDDLKEQGIDFTTDDKGDKSKEFNLLCCLNGTIFLIDDDFTVTQNENNFYGIGSGGDYAIGALHAGALPMKAMEIAEKLDINTEAPFLKREQRRIDK